MKEYDFSDYKTFKELFRDLYYRNITIDEAESKQDEFNAVLYVLKKYSLKHDKYVILKNNLLDNASKFYEGREKIIEGFKNGVFSFYYDKDYEEQMKFEEEEEEEEKLIGIIEIEDNNRKSDHLVSKYFFVSKLKHLLEYFKENKNDPEKNNQLVTIIISGLKDLNNEIKEMSEEKREKERVDEITEIVQRILAYIEQQQQQQGQGTKIQTPDQMLSRLSISLAHLHAGNNSEKLKNEMRQLLSSLYCSKNMTKQIYNNLIKSMWIKNIIIVHKVFTMIMIMIMIIVTIKGTHYKKWR